MTTTNSDTPLFALQDLGFSEIEALVYIYLLRGEPSTGYRISHGIGKPTANTYKAVASLEQRGAVQVDEGGNRLITAVPPGELLARLERRARERHEAARATLADLERDDTDDRLYTLREPQQVLERARAMLARAEQIALGDLFPAVIEALDRDLEAAVRRGVRVVVKAYRPCDLAGVEVVLPTDGARALTLWPGQQLSLVVDADEHLLAMFDRDLTHVHQAVWSRSTFLSCLQHNHVAVELLSTAYERALADPQATGDEAIARLRQITVLTGQPKGLRRLRERFGATGPIPTSPEEESLP